MKHKKFNAGRVLWVIAIIICILVILGAGGCLLNYWLQSQKNEKLLDSTVETYVVPVEEGEQQVVTVVPDIDDEEEPPVYPVCIANIDFQALQAQSDNVCGWIQVSGLENIDMPVVWSGENAFYLTHAWDGSYTAHGAIFMEALNDRSFSDAYTVLYGHNMKDGSMFGSLKKYADASFYQENGGLITIYLPDQVQIYQIFSARYVAPDDEGTYAVGFAHDALFGEFLTEMARTSLYDTGITVDEEDQVITLSTCAGSTQRFVVHAKLIQTVE